MIIAKQTGRAVGARGRRRYQLSPLSSSSSSGVASGDSLGDSPGDSRGYFRPCFKPPDFSSFDDGVSRGPLRGANFAEGEGRLEGVSSGRWRGDISECGDVLGRAEALGRGDADGGADGATEGWTEGATLGAVVG